jgi:hypothetical protein
MEDVGGKCREVENIIQPSGDNHTFPPLPFPLVCLPATDIKPMSFDRARTKGTFMVNRLCVEAITGV